MNHTHEWAIGATGDWRYCRTCGEHDQLHGKSVVFRTLCALQSALGVAADGQIGPDTLRALERAGVVVGGRRRQPSSSWDPDPPRLEWTGAGTHRHGGAIPGAPPHVCQPCGICVRCGYSAGGPTHGTYVTCDCSVATKCPQGRVGFGNRCTIWKSAS